MIENHYYYYYYYNNNHKCILYYYFYFKTGNRAIVVIKGHESYELLQSSCVNVFNQVNNLIDKGKVSIDGKDIATEVFLGGDYKAYFYKS